MERSNEKALRIVEQQYNSFINLQDSWDFFRGLAEYTRTVREMTQTKPFIRALETQREMARKTYEMMNSKAMKELTQSANKLIPIAEKVIKQYEPIIKQTQEIAEKYQPVIKAVQEVHDRMAGLRMKCMTGNSKNTKKDRVQSLLKCTSTLMLMKSSI